MTTPTTTTAPQTRRLSTPAIVLLVIAAIALIGAIVLAGVSKTIPDQLWTAFFAALTGGAGNALPSRTDAP